MLVVLQRGKNQHSAGFQAANILGKMLMTCRERIRFVARLSAA
jgi:hypothetical protein